MCLVFCSLIRLSLATAWCLVTVAYSISLMHSHRGPLLNHSHRFSSYPDRYKTFSTLFLSTMRVFCAFLDRMYSLFDFYRPSSLNCSYLCSFSPFSLMCPLCLGLSGVSVHSTTTSSRFSVITVTFRDFDLNISSVCVFIFPRWTLAYQVSIRLACQYLEERYQWSCIGILYHFSHHCILPFLPFTTSISR